MKEYLSFYDCYSTSEELWFSNNIYNGLFRYDFLHKKTEFVRTFPGMGWGRKGLHQRVIRYDNKLFFIPGNSSFIHILNLENRIMDAIPMELVNDISEIHVNNNLLYILPKFLGRPEVVFNLDNYEILMNYDMDLICRQYMQENSEKLFYRIYMDDSIAWLPLLNSNIILEYDYVNRRLIEKYTLPISGLNGIMRYNGSMWVINGKKYVYNWDPCVGIIKKYDLPSDDINVRALSLNILNDNLFVFVLETCDIFIYNEAEDKFDKWSIPASDYFAVEHACSQWARFSGGVNMEDRAIINQFATNALISINKDNECEIIEVYTTKSQDKLIAQRKFQCAMRKGYTRETEEFTLSDYIKGV